MSQEQDRDSNLKNVANKLYTLLYLRWTVSNTLALILSQG